jgi:hypothetical protein
MGLTNEELKATRKLNGADTKIVLDYSGIKEKIYEIEQWKSTKLRDEDAEQYEYLRGKLSVLYAIKEGDLSKI